MIANNIFRIIGDFFTNTLFSPYDSFRFLDNWWVQNTISWTFIIIAIIAFFYWLNQLNRYKKIGNE